MDLYMISIPEDASPQNEYIYHFELDPPPGLGGQSYILSKNGKTCVFVKPERFFYLSKSRDTLKGDPCAARVAITLEHKSSGDLMFDCDLEILWAPKGEHILHFLPATKYKVYSTTDEQTKLMKSGIELCKRLTDEKTSFLKKHTSDLQVFVGQITGNYYVVPRLKGGYTQTEAKIKRVDHHAFSHIDSSAPTPASVKVFRLINADTHIGKHFNLTDDNRYSYGPERIEGNLYYGMIAT